MGRCPLFVVCENNVHMSINNRDMTSSERSAHFVSRNISVSSGVGFLIFRVWVLVMRTQPAQDAREKIPTQGQRKPSFTGLHET